MYNPSKFKKFLKQINESHPHNCEECGCYLGHQLVGMNISHIVGGDLSSKHYYNPENINVLCKPCHRKWEYGDRKSMRIYARNQVVINRLRLDGY